MKPKKPIPFDFVLEAIEHLQPYSKAFFGCTGVYVGEQIMVILREKSDHREDNGVWLATSPEHHASLKREFPSLRSIELLSEGRKTTNWQNLPSSEPGFEEEALQLCKLILAGDARIGKVPKRKKAKAKTTAPKKGAKRALSKR